MRSKSLLSRVDFCVTTFKRPRAIERLILSVGMYYPEAKVYVGDQNESLDHCFYKALASSSALARPPEVHHLDFDCGVSAARNHLFASTPNEYKLILDDDFVFTEQTKVDILVKLLDGHPNAGVVGGDWARNGQVRNSGGDLYRRGDTLVTVPYQQTYLDYGGIRYAIVDIVSNFALMRRELFAHVQWDPALKVTEHRDFYIRVKETSYTVLFTPDVVIDHPHVDEEPDYRQFRLRRTYMKQMLCKHGLAGVSRVDSSRGMGG